MRRPLRLIVLCLVGAALLPAASAGPALAASFTVTKTDDTNDGACAAADCSLREAIVEANATADADVVTLPAGNYLLTRPGVGDDLGATGDLDVGASLTIAGAGARATAIDAAGLDRVFDLRLDTAAVTISGVTITGGGGVAQGAGVFNNATTTLRDVTVRGNTAKLAGPSGQAQGGGIYDANRLTLENVTLSSNDAVRDATNLASGQGGGIYAKGQLTTLSNVTVSDNLATGAGAQGGGLYLAGPIKLTNATIAANRADASAGGVYAFDTAPSGAVFKNTIVAGNGATAGSPQNCFYAGTTQISGGNNLDSTAECGFSQTTDVLGADALLGPLQDNGGPTDTRALLPGSPAIDAGDGGSCPSTDQRGVSRLPGGLGGFVCDIGAYESDTPADVAVSVEDSPNPIRRGSLLTYSVTVTNLGPSPATGVRLTHPIAAAAIESITVEPAEQGSCSGTTCSLGSLAKGATVEVTIETQVTQTGALSASFSVRGSQPDPVATNNTDKVTTIVKNLTFADLVTRPSLKRCVDRKRFRISVGKLPDVAAETIVIFVGGRRVRRVSVERFTGTIKVRTLPRRRARVRIVVTTTDGRRVEELRVYRVCPAKRKARRRR